MIHINKTVDSLYIGDIPSINSKYYGKLYNNNGTSYQGYFVNGKKNGYGEEFTNEGYSKGYFVEDKLNGKAITYNKIKGTFIDGYYENGQLNGECSFYDEKNILLNKNMYKNGKSCVASFEIIKNDQGKIIYEGYVYDDKYNGFGKLFENDKVYIGNFTTGKKDGKFLVCYNDGSLVYTPPTNVDNIIDFNKINKDTFQNYKNTIIFSNDMYDDSHKIIFREKGTTIYNGKLNTEMNFHDDSGVYYQLNTTYTGKFENGKFIHGTLNIPGLGKCKGNFKDYNLDGKCIVEFENGNKYEGHFTDNKSINGLFTFKYNSNNITIQSNLSIVLNNFEISFPNEISINLDSNNKYTGSFRYNKNGNPVFVSILSGKHYFNNKLVYEGDFKNYKYHGTGITYHDNGNINVTGTFEEGEPLKAEYYDEQGFLIFSDLDNATVNHDTPEMQQNFLNIILNAVITQQNDTGSNNIPQVELDDDDNDEDTDVDDEDNDEDTDVDDEE